MRYTISVAMATYNGEKYLREQLDSIYSQTRIPDEVMVSDDHSQDGTVEILEEYRKSKGLKYVVNDKPLGINKNFENAVRLCTGDYICISDQDDVWAPNKVEMSIKKLLEIEGAERIPSAVSSAVQIVDKNMNVLPTIIRNHDINKFEESISGYVSQGCTLCFNRELLEIILPFPRKELLYDDYIGTAAACIGNKYFIAQRLMYYRAHDNNAHYGRFNKTRSTRLFRRILLKISYIKYNTLMRSQRFDALKYIYKRFETELSPERKIYISRLLRYQSGSLYEKLSSIKFIVPKRKARIKILIITVIMHFIPIKEIDKYSAEGIL